MLLFFLLLLILHGDTRSQVRLHFFHLLTSTEREKDHQSIAHCFCRWRESKPGCLRSKRVHYPLLLCLLAILVLFDLNGPKLCFNCLQDSNSSRRDQVAQGAPGFYITKKYQPIISATQPLLLPNKTLPNRKSLNLKLFVLGAAVLPMT